MGADPPDADPGSGALSRIEEDPTVSDSAEPEELCAEPPPEELTAGSESPEFEDSGIELPEKIEESSDAALAPPLITGGP